MNSISVIIPTFNRFGELKRVLHAYETQTTLEPFELIVVDDASNDFTWEFLQTYQPQRFNLRVEKMDENGGPAKARNRAIPMANAPLLLFTGDDILPDRFFLAAHLAAHRMFRAETDAILGHINWPDDMPVNSLMRHIDGVGAQQFAYLHFKDGQEVDFRYLYTSNISIKRDFLLNHKPWFDTDFRYLEDLELGYRLSRRGLCLRYSRYPVGYHYHYHCGWSFTDRQFHAGLMACVLMRKHPGIRALIVGKRWPMQAYYWLFLAHTGRNRVFPADKLEREAVAFMTSQEWQPQTNRETRDRQRLQPELETRPAVDAIYARILGYFYYKGLIEGTFTHDTSQSMRGVLANRLLKLDIDSSAYIQ